LTVDDDNNILEYSILGVCITSWTIIASSHRKRAAAWTKSSTQKESVTKVTMQQNVPVLASILLVVVQASLSHQLSRSSNAAAAGPSDIAGGLAGILQKNFEDLIATRDVSPPKTFLDHQYLSLEDVDSQLVDVRLQLQDFRMCTTTRRSWR
jgi:hypothetical protein